MKRTLSTGNSGVGPLAAMIALLALACGTETPEPVNQTSHTAVEESPGERTSSPQVAAPQPEPSPRRAYPPSTTLEDSPDEGELPMQASPAPAAPVVSQPQATLREPPLASVEAMVAVGDLRARVLEEQELLRISNVDPDVRAETAESLREIRTSITDLEDRLKESGQVDALEQLQETATELEALENQVLQ